MASLPLEVAATNLTLGNVPPSVIVAVCRTVPSVALSGIVRLIFTVSLDSLAPSSTNDKKMFLVVSPGANVSVPAGSA